MTLHPSQPPAGALHAVHAALGSEVALRQPAAAVLRHGDLAPQPALALPVHTLRGPAPRLAAADRTGWRFLVRAGAQDQADNPPAEPGCPPAGRAAEPGESAAGEGAVFSEEALAGVAAAAEVVQTADGPLFSHFTAGPYLDSAVRALRQAWQLTQGAPSPYEPRLLSLPDHYATALWLHSGHPGEDLLIPLAPAPLGVTAHQVLPAAELLARLEHSPAARPTALIG
ncbi:hypothetical protein AB0K51_12185 [Kitasatospora sp. NPDC049285]|uniref:hypothetical protein n=1 Tax=Kitasatospora sp. NPDC049285 TaxID=3157096 RepID=UPI00343CFF90